MWEASTGSEVGRLSKHLNAKNFVGLDVLDDLVVSGSEAHEVVCYNIGVSDPLCR